MFKVGDKVRLKSKEELKELGLRDAILSIAMESLSGRDLKIANVRSGSTWTGKHRGTLEPASFGTPISFTATHTYGGWGSDMFHIQSKVRRK